MENTNVELLSAAQTGDCSKIETLVNQGADVNTQNKEGQTSLIIASSCGFEKCVNLLISLGADVDKRDSGEKVKRSSQRKHRRLNVDPGPIGGRTALMYAVIGCKYTKYPNCYLECVRYLIQAGADVNATDMRGTTALMYASMTGSIESAKLLVDARANVNKVDSVNMSALCCAAYQLTADYIWRVESVIFSKYKYI